MTRVITEPCIGVKSAECVDVCPVDCIHESKSDEHDIYYIDPDDCIDCGACESVCPVEAIFPEEDLPEGQEKWTEINAQLATEAK